MRRLLLLLTMLSVASFSFSQITASHGLSKPGDNIRLGQNVGNPSNPARLINDRQIPTNDFSIILTDDQTFRSTSLGGRFITQIDSTTNLSSGFVPGKAYFAGTDGSATYSSTFFDMFRVSGGSLVSQLQA